jgi:hypothetical protein
MASLGNILSQSSVDSGALRGLSAVVHKFGQAGTYAVNILKVSEPAAGAPAEVTPVALLSVTDVAPITAAAAQAATSAPENIATVDLAGMAAPQVVDPAQNVMQAFPGGYALFHAQTGDTGYAVVVQPQGAAASTTNVVSESFDSRQLGAGDIFATVLLAPGTYALTNAINGTQGTITVPYPVTVPGMPYQPPDPVAVECDANGFVPSAIVLEPMQGLRFNINTPARIRIDLTTPDSGPAKA